MSRRKRTNDDPELIKLREADRELLLRHKDLSELPKKLALELRERESTMPPLPEIEDRKRRLQHEMLVSRGEVANLLRDQNRSLLLLVLLITAAGSLVWWGLKIMQG